MSDAAVPVSPYRQPDGVFPAVGITTDVRDYKGSLFHMGGEKYLTGVADGAGAIPLMIPNLDDRIDLDALLDRLDGLIFTGSPSNVEPVRYGHGPSRAGTLHDPQRDATTLSLARRAIAVGVPMLAICRGIQELNAALGGTLHQHVQELPGRLDHRSNDDDPKPVQYGPAHPIEIVPGGMLAAIATAAGLDIAGQVVNSLHQQAIDTLAPGLRVEARAPDGIIEAVSMPGAHGFLLALQWHPEWRVLSNPLSAAIFRAFGDAAAARARTRIAPATRGSRTAAE